MVVEDVARAGRPHAPGAAEEQGMDFETWLLLQRRHLLLAAMLPTSDCG